MTPLSQKCGVKQGSAIKVCPHFSILRNTLPGHSKKIVHWLFCVFQTKLNKGVNILILFLSENSSKWYFHVVFLIYHLLKRTFEEWFHNGNKVKSKLWITWWIMPCELHDGSYSTLICNPCLDLKSFLRFIFSIPQFQIL